MAGFRYSVSMVSFAHAWVLALLPLAFAIGWWSLRSPRPALKHSLVAAFRQLPRGRANRVRTLQAAFAVLAAICWIFALANPRRPDLHTKIPVEGIGIVLALDLSGSMATEDFVPSAGATPISRFDAAKQTLNLFVAGGATASGPPFTGRPDDRIGLIAFSSVPVTVCPLTLNHSVLLAVLRDQRTAGALNAETNIGDALGEGCIRLETVGPGRRKVLVLLSDGEHNKVGNEVLNPKTAAALAEKLQIPIYTIDCGGDPVGIDAAAIQQRFDGRAVLEEVSRVTGGQSFVANDGEDLRNAFRTIDALERRAAPANLYRRYFEYGGWCAGAALALLGFSGVLNATRWRRNP